MNRTNNSFEPSEIGTDEQKREDKKKTKKAKKTNNTNNNINTNNNNSNENKNNNNNNNDNNKNITDNNSNNILISEVGSNIDKEVIEIIENKKIDNKEEVKNKKLERRKSDYSEISIIPQNKNAYYDKDSDICSVNSNLIDSNSKFDLKSEKNYPNPPRRNENKSQNLHMEPNDNKNNEENKSNNKNFHQTFHNDNVSNKIKDKLTYNNISSDSKALKSDNKKSINDNKDNKNRGYQYGVVGEFFQKRFNFMNKAKITKELFEKTDELLTLEEFDEKYSTFPYIYLADLKKHHLIYFTFIACNDNNNLFLKLSYFALTINFYCGLNTMLIFN